MRTSQTRFPSAAPSASLGASAHQGFGRIRQASAHRLHCVPPSSLGHDRFYHFVDRAFAVEFISQ